MHRTALGFLLSVMIVVAGQVGLGANASAEPAPPVGPHRHYILIDGERVYIGPNFCSMDATTVGFAQFHDRVHANDPGIGMLDVRGASCP